MGSAGMKTIIMAGGRGTRLNGASGDLPKPLVSICGKPVLEHEIEVLRKQGFREIILTVSYLSDRIMEYFGDGSGESPVTGRLFGVSIRYYVEKEPLGNAGALLKLLDEGVLSDDEDFLLLNADALFEVDLKRFLAFHKQNGALATLFTHPNDHPFDSGLILADEKKRVERWLTKEDKRPEYYKNRVNAGLHVLNTVFLRLYGESKDWEPSKRGKIDLDRDILRLLAGTGKLFCYDSPEYVKDMGTPERLREVEEDLKTGLVSAKSLKRKQKAVFLDRDGTINKEVGFLRHPEELELLPGAAEGIRKINRSGYLAIVITNQPVIARGEVTEKELKEIHNKLETLLGEEGAYLDAVYYCPHHPDKGFPGEIPELKIDCECRKPKPGLLYRAARDFNIDLSKSIMIGDSERDILAGKAANLRTVLLCRDQRSAPDFEQDATASCLTEVLP